MPTIIEVLRDLATASQLTQIAEALDCICDKMDGIGGGSDPVHMPYPPPEPGPITAPPPITGDDDPVTAGQPTVCQAAYGFASHIKTVCSELGQLASTQQIDPAAVGDVARTVGTNMFVQLVQSVLAAIWGEVVRILNAFGFAIGAVMATVAEDIPDDIFVCAFLGGYDGAAADPVVIAAACQAAIREHLSGSQVLIGLMVATFIWPAKVQAYLAGEARDDMDEPIPLDLSGFPSICGCVQRYGIISEFRGYHANNEVDNCEHPDFDPWEGSSFDPLPDDARFVGGFRCSDNEEFAALNGSSAFTMPFGFGNGYTQLFSLDVPGDYTLYARPGRVGFPGGGTGVIRIDNLDLAVNETFDLVGGVDQDINHFLLENYPAGNYKITAYRTGSTSATMLVELYVAPGDNPEGAA